ncbi:uncharacterized protein LOC112177212 [Rosa chinensis]|uniref:uncharacterized protein LOC112177212 n=1 Tax=Rosa chinensis TaxID=74649 RepID=UPI001AD935E7|nr:uncharacterized protein LOC112177212 [Rosa chinensis]
MSSSYKAAQSVAGFFGKRQQTQFLHCFRFAITISCVIHQIEFGFLSITLSRQDYQESMQRSIWIVLLPLFLVLLLGVSLVSYCYSDFGNSERSKSTNFLDSVMASTSTMKRVKRLLEGGRKSNQFDQVNSKRWKRI